MGILQVQVLFEGWVRLERRGLQGRFSRASFPSLSAARAGTQYSLQCTRLEPVVVVPIKDRVLQPRRTVAGIVLDTGC